MALRLFSRRKSKKRNELSHPNDRAEQLAKPPGHDFVPAPAEVYDDDPLQRLKQLGRHNVILRERAEWLNRSGGQETVREVESDLEQRMALVPSGTVSLCTALSAQPGSGEEEVDVEPFLLDTYAVTNARFQRFIDAGGYDALEFWPEEIWPHLIELKDLTGQPAPKFWRQARHQADLSNHPVAGVSWYEAQAYALWIGQRLPTESEWQMAASWHIKSSTDIMRRFPWGDSMDVERCNLWASGHRKTVPVTEYPTGAAPNQVRQLVGNVWEWTDSEFSVSDDEGRPIIGEMPMRVVRGGAYDTYFDTQAMSTFRTGELALIRTHNTGFRCAMDLSEATWMT